MKKKHSLAQKLVDKTYYPHKHRWLIYQQHIPHPMVLTTLTNQLSHEGYMYQIYYYTWTPIHTDGLLNFPQNLWIKKVLEFDNELMVFYEKKLWAYPRIVRWNTDKNEWEFEKNK